MSEPEASAWEAATDSVGSPAGGPASDSIAEPASGAASEPAAARETEPAVARETEPAVARETEPAVARETEPAATRETEPAATRETEPAATRETEPAATRETELRSGPPAIIRAAPRARPQDRLTPSSRPGISDAPAGQPARPPARRTTPAPPAPRPQPRGRQQREADSPAGDMMAGLQRWLIRSSARNMRREIEGQVKRTLGGGRAEPQDVWGTATTEPPPDLSEAPECAWCPICRAARRMRETGPGLGPHLSGASDAVAAAVQDALGALDGVLSRTAAPPGREPPADRSPGSGHADSAASDAAERAEHEPGDRG
jgi:hypothetical protein